MQNVLSSAVEAAKTFGAHTLEKLPGIFREDRQPVSYDMLFKDPTDGCARYDDVWGA